MNIDVKVTKKLPKSKVSYRLDTELLTEFRALTKKHGYSQTNLLEEALKSIINTIKENENVNK